ncbi:FAD-dependent 5-carboxymethylaminomethyl-2-thiouridine(34) oxidoreductase MnmC [Thalassospira profundimaris]|uniref:FAD-dependent 5-carboxymethylaminomethyl-2-thiouridine(34) oxidoreductase MnmC n=1 Tax=Thalassospira profundimaris TaxID=502049 RepID=UPI000DEDEE85|nr:FAD-dependent 5-carboxymethylaminomethyl-2-thiouridine(34) oxidoreductase MnmC [Thalassospira profundimaris]
MTNPAGDDRAGAGSKAGYKLADKPWFAPAAPFIRSPRHTNDVAVIGGGIAGASCCHALNKLGIGTTLFERHARLATEASGNPIGMLEPYITADNSLAGRYYEAGFRHSSALVRQKLNEGAAIEAAFCGVLSLPATPRDETRQRAILEKQATTTSNDNALSVNYFSAVDASKVLGMPVPGGGLFYRDAGWVNPPSVCNVLAEKSVRHTGQKVTQITSHSTGGVQLHGEDGAILGDFAAVIIAGAMETSAFAQTTWMQDYLIALRGQISCFSKAILGDLKVNCVLSHKGYLTPERNGQHVFGATFDRHANHTDMFDSDHDANIAQLALALPDLAKRLSPAKLTGRAGLRTTTPDHLPLIGPAPDYRAYLEAYPDLDKGRHYARYCRAPYHKDVYVCTGFGARGMIGAPLAAELIASHITGQRAPLADPVREAVHPARYIVRAIKRGLIAPREIAPREITP